MRDRIDRLNRLTIQTSCQTSWANMNGTGARRYCAACRRSVFDFERMLPTEIERHLQAAGGRICARLTRREGELVFAAEPAPAAVGGTSCAHHLPVMAAGLVTAWLGAGSVQAQVGHPFAAVAALAPLAGDQEGEPPAQATMATRTAGLSVRVQVDGAPLAGVIVIARNRFDDRETSAITDREGGVEFSSLASGMYRVDGKREGYRVYQGSVVVRSGEGRQIELSAVLDQGGTLLGALAVSTTPLPELYDDSDLVVAATVGPSVIRGKDESLVEVETRLTVDEVMKGEESSREIAYRHSESTDAEGPDGWSRDFAVGSQVVAFLQRSKESGVRGTPRYTTPIPWDAIKHVDGHETAAYRERISALARMERDMARQGENDPGAMAEWMVATAENAATREESVNELSRVIYVLTNFAESEGVDAPTASEDLQDLLDQFHAEGGLLGSQPSPELIGAYVTGEQKARLTRALLATETFRSADRDLYALVRNWDEPSAKAWLLRRLRTDQSDPSLPPDVDEWALKSLADDLGNKAMRELVERAELSEGAISSKLTNAASGDERARLAATSAALQRTLRRDIAQLLAAEERGHPSGEAHAAEASPAQAAATGPVDDVDEPPRR
jgi:hypothetical protein